jgi:gamma-glutamyltranspeptidase/glutathione hydrolase
VIRAAAAAATSPTAAEAACRALEAGGSAADAIIAGFFADAGAHPGVLFAPAVALVAGTGVGARAFDGRAAQPGTGASRPRGYVDEASIPDGARVAAPRSLSMLVLLHSYWGRATMSTLVRPGVVAAERAGAKVRAALLRKAGAAGVLSLRSPEILPGLLAVGGTLAGGTLTAADLKEARPAETEAVTTMLADGTSVFVPPWPPKETGADRVEAIVTCDGRGIIGSLTYVPGCGVAVPDLELEVGREAIPVRRGVTRITPGTPLLSTAPMAILHRKGGFAAAIVLPDQRRVDPASLAALSCGVAAESALAELSDHGRGGTVIAVVSDGRVARAIRSGD